MKRKKYFIIGIILLLIPYILGAIFYKSVPDTIATHFNSMGEPDGYSSKIMALFGIPSILLLIYIFSFFITNKDPRRKYQSEKIMKVVLLIIPLIANLSTVFIIFYSKGIDINIANSSNILLGILFIVIGNYLPKTKRNYTVGIKLPWTLDNDYVWDKTHRLAGYIWIVGGIIILINSISINFFFIYPTVIIIMVIIPIVYSYFLYNSITEK